MSGIKVKYLTLPTDGDDEAISLSDYLNQHGVFAVAEKNEVICPLENPNCYPTVERLCATWPSFWEHSDSGLFGLPMYVKPQ